MDATNPLVFSSNAPPRLERGFADSGGEQVQRWLPDARVVNALNIIGSAHMFHPQFPGGPPNMFICGNDPAAKKAVSDVRSAFGFRSVIDVGGIEGARLLETLVMLWIVHGARSGSWNHAFTLLRK